MIPAQTKARQMFFKYLNKAIQDVASGIENCIIIDENKVVHHHGHKKVARNLIPKRFREMAHTSVFGELLAKEQYLLPIKAIKNFKKTKVLLLDFDNTLWKGVMGDEEVCHYHDIQENLKKLKDSGILLCAVSKNSISNIRWDEMTLKPEDFVVKKINWQPKAQNIMEIAQELNLGLDSFVFIDDNPVERELVESQVPSVVTLDATDPDTWKMIDMLHQFPNTQDTESASARTKLYQEQAQRAESMGSGLDHNAMMGSLDLEMKIREAVSSDLKRVAELVARTNQFNTTTQRYSKTELAKMFKDSEVKIFVSELKDKFGDLGVVCIGIVKIIDGSWEIDSFIMSCRAMGFSLEQQMIWQIVKSAKENNATLVKGRFIPSDRNQPCENLFLNCGFEKDSANDFSLAEANFAKLEPVSWIQVHES